MSEHKSSLAQAVDEALALMVYGPVGLAITAREELPRMVDKGRHRLGGQVMLARMIGEHATRHGQQVVSQAFRQPMDTLVGLGLLPAGPRGGTGRTPVTDNRPGRNATDVATGASSPVARAAPSDTATVTGPVTAGNGRVDPAGGERAPASAELAIPGYDSLSASQVVQRLAGLDLDELDAVRSYEAGGRGRRTVLNRIAQLQSGPS